MGFEHWGHAHLEFFIGMSCGAVIMLASLLVLMRNGVPDPRIHHYWKRIVPASPPARGVVIITGQTESPEPPEAHSGLSRE